MNLAKSRERAGRSANIIIITSLSLNWRCIGNAYFWWRLSTHQNIGSTPILHHSKTSSEGTFPGTHSNFSATETDYTTDKHPTTYMYTLVRDAGSICMPRNVKHLTYAAWLTSGLLNWNENTYACHLLWQSYLPRLEWYWRWCCSACTWGWHEVRENLEYRVASTSTLLDCQECPVCTARWTSLMAFQ